KRGWEWKFLERRADNVVGTIPSNSSLIGFTRDGARMAINNAEDHHIQWCDFSGHPQGPVISTGSAGFWGKFDSDGARLLTASAEGVIGLWDRSGAPIHAPVPTNEKWAVVKFSEDGSKLVAQLTDGQFSTWDATGQRLGGPSKVEDGTLRLAFYSDDGGR